MLIKKRAGCCSITKRITSGHITGNKAKALSRDGLSRDDARERLKLGKSGFRAMLIRETGHNVWPMKGFEP